MLKNIRTSALISAAMYILAGLLLIFYPEISVTVVCKILGICVLAVGILKVMNWFILDLRSSLMRNDLLYGLIAVIVGIVILTRQEMLLDFIPLVTGLIICISGLGKLQSSAIAVRIGYSNALIYFLLSIVSIVFGVWVMFFVQGMFAAKTVFMLIGAGLLFSGLSDLFVTVFLSAKYTSYVKKFEREHNIIDAEVVDEKEEKE